MAVNVGDTVNNDEIDDYIRKLSNDLQKPGKHIQNRTIDANLTDKECQSVGASINSRFGLSSSMNEKDIRPPRRSLHLAGGCIVLRLASRDLHMTLKNIINLQTRY